MNRTILVEGILFVVIGAVSIMEAYRLGNISDPTLLYQMLGPGLYIFMLGLVLIISGVVHIIVGYRISIATEKVAENKKISIRVVGVAMILSAYAFLIYYFGYLAASIPFFLLLFRIFGIRSWRTSIILSLLYAGACYAIFVQYCNVIFPRGIWFR